MGNWGIFLNVLNLELRDGITAGQLAKVLYGDAAPGMGGLTRGLTNVVLRPLCRAGCGQFLSIRSGQPKAAVQVWSVAAVQLSKIGHA